VEERIKDGQLVLIYLDEKRNFFIQAKSNLRLSTDLGELDLSSIIGMPYGFVGKTHLDKEFYCLKPSTADLMFKVKRTTTIAYPKDLGLLILETSIGPGSKVLEVGTGSGALTLVLAKFVWPDGVVYTYDRRQEFIDNAKKNIELTGYIKTVEFYCRDVAKDGLLQKGVDAIFIDVPEPWHIIPKAQEALKGGHHLVSLSPNVEQVKRTVDVLKKESFKRIRVSEIAEREILVRQQGVRPKERGITHTAYLVRAQKVLENAMSSSSKPPKL
jgi:tRNA (adenine57-N1/adenine58-N1)-methyltransferase